MKRSRLIDRLIFAALTALAITMLAPLWWMIVTALSGPDAILNGRVSLWPTEVHWSNFLQVLRDLPFARFYLNTIFVTVCVTVGQVMTSAMASNKVLTAAAPETSPKPEMSP